MITTLLHLLRLCPFLCGGHRQLALENLALRQQLTVYRRTVARPRLRRGDRLFWVALSRLWRGWKQALVIVARDTVLCWQRRGFRDYWTRRSRRSVVGRPPVAPEIRALVAQMATANPLWGAPRIHGELLKLGITVAERTVSRLLLARRAPPSQTWRTFLTNHVRDLVTPPAPAAHHRGRVGQGCLRPPALGRRPRRAMMSTSIQPRETGLRRPIRNSFTTPSSPRRTFRRLGAAEGLERRDSRRLQIAAYVS